ncbi:uncharacterized protein METZ01_LOCUS476489, partial [marine metagenome]
MMNCVKKFFAGDIPLVVSYWIIGGLVSVLLHYFTIVITPWRDRLTYPSVEGGIEFYSVFLS